MLNYCRKLKNNHPKQFFKQNRSLEYQTAKTTLQSVSRFADAKKSISLICSRTLSVRSSHSVNVVTNRSASSYVLNLDSREAFNCVASLSSDASCAAKSCSSRLIFFWPSGDVDGIALCPHASVCLYAASTVANDSFHSWIPKPQSKLHKRLMRQLITCQNSSQYAKIYRN